MTGSLFCIFIAKVSAIFICLGKKTGVHPVVSIQKMCLCVPSICAKTEVLSGFVSP